MWKCEYLHEPFENVTKRNWKNVGTVLLAECCHIVENPGF